MNKQLLQAHSDQGKGREGGGHVGMKRFQKIHLGPAAEHQRTCVLAASELSTKERLHSALVLQVKTCQGRPKAVIARANLNSPLKTVCTPDHSNASMIV